MDGRDSVSLDKYGMLSSSILHLYTTLHNFALHFFILITLNVFHKRVAHTSELPTKTPKLAITAYYYTTTLYSGPYSIVIESSCLSHVRELWPIIPHKP